MGKMEDRLTLLGLDLNSPVRDAARMIDNYQILQDYIYRESHSSTVKPVVLVIGGGIMGMMCSYYLHELGYQVTVIERKSFGAAASGRNGGGILALGRDLYEIPFIRLSFELWEELTALGFDTKFVRSGHLMAAMNEYEMDKLQKAQRLYQAAGLDTALLSPKEVLSRLPDVSKQNKGALYSPIDGQGYPFTAMASLTDTMKKSGVAFIGDCEVLDFKTENGRVQSVVTNQGEFASDIFLLSTGPWTEKVGSLLDVYLPIQPRRSQIMATEILEQRRIDPFVSGNGLYLRQTHAGNVLYGGGGAWERTGFDVSNSLEAIQRLTGRFAEMFPQLGSVNLLRSFAGTVEITPDHFPLFGAVQPYRNLYVCAGFNGHGYGVAPVFGKLMANMILDHDSAGHVPDAIEHIVKRFSPSRFADGA